MIMQEQEISAEDGLVYNMYMHGLEQFSPERHERYSALVDQDLLSKTEVLYLGNGRAMAEDFKITQNSLMGIGMKKEQRTGNLVYLAIAIDQIKKQYQECDACWLGLEDERMLALAHQLQVILCNYIMDSHSMPSCKRQ